MGAAGGRLSRWLSCDRQTNAASVIGASEVGVAAPSSLEAGGYITRPEFRCIAAVHAYSLRSF